MHCLLGSAPNIPRTEPKRVMAQSQPVSWGGLPDAGDRAKAVAQCQSRHHICPCTPWVAEVTKGDHSEDVALAQKGPFALQPRIWVTHCRRVPDSSLVKNKRAGEEVVKDGK